MLIFDWSTRVGDQKRVSKSLSSSYKYLSGFKFGTLTCLQFGIRHLESTHFLDNSLYQKHLYESGTVVIAQKNLPSNTHVACEMRVLVRGKVSYLVPKLYQEEISTKKGLWVRKRALFCS